MRLVRKQNLFCKQKGVKSKNIRKKILDVIFSSLCVEIDECCNIFYYCFNCLQIGNVLIFELGFCSMKYIGGKSELQKSCKMSCSRVKILIRLGPRNVSSSMQIKVTHAKKFRSANRIEFGFVFADSSSTNTTENASPSASPPTSIVKPSPVHHSTYLNTTNDESDDDENEIIDDDMSDNVERPSDSNSPHPNGSSQNKRKKKTRTVFSRAQVFQLESTFDLKRYVSVHLKKYQQWLSILRPPTHFANRCSVHVSSHKRSQIFDSKDAFNRFTLNPIYVLVSMRHQDIYGVKLIHWQL